LSGRRAYLEAAVVILVWGGNYVVTKLAVETVPPAAFVVWRFLLTALVTAPWMVRNRPRRLAEWGKLLVLGVVGVAVYQYAFNVALKETLAANVSVLFSLAPLLTVVADGLLGGQGLNRRVWLGAGVGMVGVAVLVGGSFQGRVTGEIWALGASVLWALFTVLTDRLHPAVRGLGQTGWMGLVGSLALLPWTGLYPIWRAGSSMVWVLGYVVVLVTVVGLSLWQRLVADLGSSRTSFLLYVIPVVSSLLAWAVLGETPTWRLVAGALFVFVGVYLAERGRQAEPPTPSASAAESS
jgi:drug/metabolite transporter (DMT)-like permease